MKMTPSTAGFCLGTEEALPSAQASAAGLLSRSSLLLSGQKLVQEGIQHGQVLLSSADLEQCQELPVIDFSAALLLGTVQLYIWVEVLWSLPGTVAAGGCQQVSPLLPKAKLPVSPGGWLPDPTRR